MLRVFSIFDSIQGESSFQGAVTTFIRLAGCPLSCSYCDTRDACEAAGTAMSVTDVVGQVREHKMPYVELTGGEPLWQEDSIELLRALADSFQSVLVETSGALSIRGVDPRVHIVLDVKCPGSLMSDRFLEENLDLVVAHSHDIKFVLTSLEDLDWSLDFMSRRTLDKRRVLFSPAVGFVEPSELAAWMLERRVDVRLQLQLHRFIWQKGWEER